MMQSAAFPVSPGRSIRDWPAIQNARDVMSSWFVAMPLSANLLVFFALAAGVWFSGSRLTYFADALSDRLKLAKSLVGLVLLALATSLPEVATTLTAAVEADAELVLNNLFGGIALQTAILAIADIWSRGAITNYPRKSNHALEATILIALLACVAVIFVLDEPYAVLWVGTGSILVGAIYCAAILLMRRYDRENDWVPVDMPMDTDEPHSPLAALTLGEIGTAHLLLASGAACLAILVLGVGLVWTAEALAVQTGLGSSFVGVTVLAAATSLPELTTTITAVRMGAYTMAISNIFGSNLIMIVLVLPADILYAPGPILRSGGASAQLAIIVGILVTSVYIVGLIVRRKPRLGPLGLDSVAVLVIYTASLFMLYSVR